MEKGRLEIDPHEYKRLCFVVREHKSMVYKLNMHELIRRDLIRDMDIMQGILEKSEVKQEVSK